MKYYVVSDLHVSMGKVDGKLHPLEDFDCDTQFGDFLDLVTRNEGKLIINGDWVDFLQIEPLPQVGNHRSSAGIPLGWNVHDATRRLQTCLANHRDHFGQLADYLAHGGELTVMEGNHDPDWFFPGDENDFPLQKELRKALAATRLETMVGAIAFDDRHVARTPLVGGQWTKGDRYPWDLRIVYNDTAPAIPKTASPKPIS